MKINWLIIFRTVLDHPVIVIGTAVGPSVGEMRPGTLLAGFE
jgi:hypothetical protein